MKTIKEERLEYLVFDNLDQAGLRHGFTTRLGGVSEGSSSSMNLSFSRGDTEAHVIENYKIIMSALSLDYQKSVLTRQTHTKNIVVVSEEHCGYGMPGKARFDDVDGLVTNQPNIPLVSFYADCTPLFFYDPVQGVVATAHAGWRGTLKRIGSEMIQLMGREYGSKPKDILIGIGPAIGQCCFEVDQDVADLFYDLPEAYQTFIEMRDNGKYHIDVKAINRLMFLEQGVRPDHIEMSSLCTKCNPNRFFSHRAHGDERGNLSAIIAL